MMNTVVYKIIVSIFCLVFISNIGFSQKQYRVFPLNKISKKEKKKENEEKEEKKIIDIKKKENTLQFSLFFNGNKSDVINFPKLNGVEPFYPLDEQGLPYYTFPSDRTFSFEIGVHKIINDYFRIGGFFEYGQSHINHPGYDFNYNGKEISYERLYANPHIYHFGVDLKLMYNFFFVSVRGGLRVNNYGASFKIIYKDQVTQFDEFNSSNLGTGIYPLFATNVGFTIKISHYFDLGLRSGFYFNSDRILAKDYTVSYINLQAGIGLIYKLYQ